MNAPVEVHFQGLQKSEAIEQQVRAKVAKLEKHFGRITSCRVVIEAAQRNVQKPNVYGVKIEIGVPKQPPIIISHDRKGSHASEELTMALRDAFDAALRKLDDVAAKLGQRTKLERGRRRAKPVPDETAS